MCLFLEGPPKGLSSLGFPLKPPERGTLKTRRPFESSHSPHDQKTSLPVAMEVHLKLPPSPCPESKPTRPPTHPPHQACHKHDRCWFLSPGKLTTVRPSRSKGLMHTFVAHRERRPDVVLQHLVDAVKALHFFEDK